jgi:hypothetical protein
MVSKIPVPVPADAFSSDKVFEPRRGVFADYQVRAREAQQRLSSLDAKGAWLANARAVSFFGALVLVGLSAFNQLDGRGYLGSAVLGLVYAIAAAWHHRVLTEEDKLRLTLRLLTRGMARLTHRWLDFEEQGQGYLQPNHLYVPDLDVFGHGSLFQLLDETATQSGEARLASWLSSKTGAAALEERQQAVRELAPKVDFRQGLLIEARKLARGKADPRRFIAWAEGPDALKSIRWALPLAFILPATTLTLWILGRVDVVPSTWVWFGLLAQLLIAILVRKPLGEMYEQIIAGEQGFVRFDGAFRKLEQEPLQAPRLKALQQGLQSAGTVSSKLARFGRLFAFAELRQSGQVHAVVQLLTLWDIHWLFAIERWRKAHGTEVRGWFDGLAEVEALFSLATFTHERPDYVFARIQPGHATHFVARGLGHPLLETPVVNDVAFEHGGEAIILTGSNMSGKSTLLRAMGANTVLALAGAPVCAQSLELSELDVLTSMRVKDSLERGVSYFYAEVQRMKAVLDAAVAAKGHALVLLDEILLGTNTKERQMASRGLLRLLLDAKALVAVTTHDLSLTTLQGSRVKNFHFQDALVNGEMRFDYQLRPGVVETTNALRVLELSGIQLPSQDLLENG